MQCGQPLYGNVLYSQNYPINTGPLPNANPEIVGEGDVISLVFPDGSVQYYFQPRNNPFSPYISKNMWIVRTISSPNMNDLQKYIAPPPCFSPYLLPATSHAPVNAPQHTDYNLKFHNDGCTSTTDLHYFVPRLRHNEWISKYGALYQPEVLTESGNEYVTASRGKDITNTVSMMSLDEGGNKQKQYQVTCECRNMTKAVCPCRNVHQENNNTVNVKCKCGETNTDTKNARNNVVSNKIKCQCGDTTENSNKDVKSDGSEERLKRKPNESINISNTNKIKSNSKTKRCYCRNKTCNKKTSTYTDQSSSYTCDQNCGTTSDNITIEPTPPETSKPNTTPPKQNTTPSKPKVRRKPAKRIKYSSSECSCCD